MFSILKVNGNSMHPTLASGVFVLVLQCSFCGKQRSFEPISLLNKCSEILYPKLSRFPIFRHALILKLNVGDIVVVNHATYGQVIKRITTINYDKNHTVVQIRIAGDNRLVSVSEEEMGWVDAACVIGKVIYVIKKNTP